ncbi:A24 family peptidase [Paraburkholderia sp. PREW-6R]|uniref:A24 family peptidase n=1 Tax=Paraburkholderia sp. PREW-6R TaxID=3141544 RepID=UPI0031F57D43
MIYLATLIIFIAWAAAVAMCDCRSRRIPHSLVAAGLAAAFLCALLKAGPFNVSAGHALLGAVAGLLALLPFFALGVMGAADVKVFSVLGAWCGASALPGLWIIASIAGGLHALWLLTAARTRLARSGSLTSRGQRNDPAIALAGKAATPYGACLSLAAFVWLAVHIHHGGAP